MKLSRALSLFYLLFPSSIEGGKITKKKGEEQIRSKKKKSLSKSASINGVYSGLDTEDGTFQKLSIFCTDDLCDIVLSDIAFSTCIEITGNAYYGGVGIAKDVAKDSLDNFKIGLFCLERGQFEINPDTDTPLTTLTGDFSFLEDGIIRRSATGFSYFQISPNTDNTREGSISNGQYFGIDTEDGSSQLLEVFCKEGLCDITLQDISFSTCFSITRIPFYNGMGVARNIPEDSLDSFKIDIFCLQPGREEVDIYNDTPLSSLTGNLAALENGIIRRTGPGFIYSKKSTPGGPNKTGRWSAQDATNLSIKGLSILCSDSLCDIMLNDNRFSACNDAAFWNENQSGGFKSGAALAKDIPEDSLDDFDLKLFCHEGDAIDFDNDSPVSTIKGDLVFHEEGMVSFAGSETMFFNQYQYKGDDSTGKKVSKKRSTSNTQNIANGIYFGNDLDGGSPQTVSVLCYEGLCDIDLWDPSFRPCMALNGRNLWNGVATARGVSENSLDNFELSLFCLPKDQVVVDIDTDTPSSTLKGDFVLLQQAGIITLTAYGTNHFLVGPV